MKHYGFRLIPVAVLGLALMCAMPGGAARLSKEDRLAKRVAKLDQLLGSERFNLRAVAAKTLGELGITKSAPEIHKLLKDSEVGVREAAARALGRLKYLEAVEDLVKLLEDSSLIVQKAAIEALGNIGSAKAVDPLVDKAKKNKEESLFFPIGVALGRIAEKKAGPTIYTIFKAVKDDVEKCRLAAGLGRINGAEATNLLEALHKNDDMRVKYESLWAAGEMNNADGLAWLIKRIGRIQSLVTYYDDETGVRDAFATAIGRMKSPDLLRKMLKEGEKEGRSGDKVPKDLVMMIRGVGRSRVPELYEDVKSYVTDGNDEVKLAAIEAVGLLGNPKGAEPLLKALKSHTFQVKVGAGVALGELGVDEAIDPMLELLKNEDWRLRYVAARALMNNRVEDMVPALLECMKNSSEWLQKELGGMMREITGKDNGVDVVAWEKWWEANQGKFEIQYEEDLLSSDQTMTFYGVEINTNKVVFCIDRSGSMALPASEWEDTVSTEESGGKGGSDDIAPKDPKSAGKKKKGKGIKSKMDVVKAELIRTVKQLKPNVNFNILQYSSDVQPWNKGAEFLIPANDKNKEEALKYVSNMSPGGGTAIYDALRKAFLAAAGSPDGKDDDLAKLKDPKFKLEVDTIFLMTDGTPMGGQLADPAKILEAVQEWNKLGRIRVHSVGVGEGQNVDFLRKLAAQNGGKYSQN